MTKPNSIVVLSTTRLTIVRIVLTIQTEIIGHLFSCQSRDTVGAETGGLWLPVLFLDDLFLDDLFLVWVILR